MTFPSQLQLVKNLTFISFLSTSLSVA